MFIYLSNTNLLQLKDLKKESTGDLLAGASVTVTVTDLAGVQLAGMAWPQAMQDVGSGDYELVLPNILSWVDATEYIAVINATTTAGVGHWELHFKSKKRTTS